MSNPFDQFDSGSLAVVEPSKSNPFDQFDSAAAEPRALSSEEVYNAGQRNLALQSAALLPFDATASGALDRTEARQPSVNLPGGTLVGSPHVDVAAAEAAAPQNAGNLALGSAQAAAAALRMPTGSEGVTSPLIHVPVGAADAALSMAMPLYDTAKAISPDTTQGVAESVAETASGLTSPMNLGLMVALPLASKPLQFAAGAIFSAQAGMGAHEAFDKFSEATDPRERAKFASQMILDTAMAAAPVVHGYASLDPVGDLPGFKPITPRRMIDAAGMLSSQDLPITARVLASQALDTPKMPASVPPPLPATSTPAAPETQKEPAQPAVAPANNAATDAPKLETPAGSAPELATETEVTGHPIVEVPLNQLSLSEDVPQFKAGANDKGIVEPLEGRFDRVGVSPIQVWRRTNGKLEIISGRHRFDLAQRSGETSIPAQIHDESQGFNQQAAARLDAELNIRDGQGSTGDYANYFRNSEVTRDEAESRGLLARAKGKAGFSIAEGASDDVFALHQQGRLTDAQAAAIAEAAPGDAAAQTIGTRAALDGKSADLAGNLIKAAKLAVSEKGGAQTGDLFGFDDSAIRAMEDQARAASKIQRDIRDHIQAVEGASKKPEHARKLGVDVADPEGVRKKVADLRTQLDRWNNWPMHPDLVALTRGEQAAEAPKTKTQDSIERARQRIAEREKQVEDFKQEHGEVTFEAPATKLDESRNAKIIVSPEPGEPGKWRYSIFDKDGASSHAVHNSWTDAVNEAVRDFGADIKNARVAESKKAPAETPTLKPNENQGDLLSGRADEPFNLISETPVEKAAREAQEQKEASDKQAAAAEKARVEAEKAQTDMFSGAPEAKPEEAPAPETPPVEAPLKSSGKNKTAAWRDTASGDVFDSGVKSAHAFSQTGDYFNWLGKREIGTTIDRGFFDHDTGEFVKTGEETVSPNEQTIRTVMDLLHDKSPEARADYLSRAPDKAKENVQEAISRLETMDAEKPPAEETPVEDRGTDIPPGHITPGASTGADIPAPKVTSLKNEVMDREREARGQPPLMAPARKAMGETWDEAMNHIEANPDAGILLVNDLLSGDKTNISPLEDAILLHEKITVMNERDAAAERAADVHSTEAEREQARATWQAMEDRSNEIDRATRAAGTIAGRALQFRQAMMRDDFTPDAMERKARMEKGEPLTPAESADIKAMSDKIADLEKRLAEKTDKANEQGSDKAFDETIKSLAGESDVTPRVASLAERVVASLEREADKARARLREKLFARTSAGVDPSIIYDLSVVGASHIARGALEFTRWSTAMIKDFGDEVKPYLQEVWDASNDHLEKQVDKMVSDKTERQKVKARVKPDDLAGQRESITTAMKERIGDDKPAVKDLRFLIQKLARNFVQEGVRDREALLTAVHDVVKEIVPDAARREVMDAISGYGDFKPLSKDEISVALRDLKGQYQQAAKIEDMQAGRAPKKTGVERRTPSDEERRLTQQVNDLKRRGGFQVTDPGRQLKSAMDAIKTRLKNQISDLSFQIGEKKRIVRDKRSVTYDEEAKALAARRDELKSQFDDIFGKPGLTDEQRIKIATDRLEKNISDYEQRIKDAKAGKFETARPPGKTPRTAELDALTARRDAMREEYQNLRSLDTALQERRATRAVQSSIDDLKARIASNDLAFEKPAGQLSTPALEALRGERETLKQKLDSLREAAGMFDAQRVEKATAALKDSIAEYDRRIREGDLAAKKTGSATPETPEIERLRAERDAMQRFYRELQNAAKPKHSPEEIALQAYKTRTASRIADLQERIASGDFADRPRKPIAYDREALDLRFKAEAVKREFNEKLIAYRQANRSVPAKIFRGVQEVLNTGRALMISLDLSAVFRQGGFIALGHPVRAARIFPDMFRALASEKQQLRIMDEIRSRSNFPLYEQSKLYLSNQNHNLSQMEEMYMSRWAGKVPLVAASERAYVTFLNRLRADSFDAMVKSLQKGKTLEPAEARAIASYVNIATGRGTFGSTPGAAAALNTAFFAPRYVASRFQLLAGAPAYRGSFRTRTLVAKEYGRFLAGVGVVYALGQMAGGRVESDPRSSDFGKLRFGNTRLDPLAGLAQTTVLISRLYSGQTMTGAGKIIPIRGEKVPYGSPSAVDLMAKFLRTKLSPAVGTGVNILTGKDVAGNPVTAASAVANMLVPLSFGDIYSALKDNEMPQGAAIAILALFGMSVQDYATRPKKERR